MKDSLLQSEEWCDLVFERRNRRYGAYVLRRDAGRRYRRVAMIMGGCFAVVLALLALTGFFFYRALEQTISEVQEVVKLHPLEDKEIKHVSVGRRAVAHASPDAVTAAPEIADDVLSQAAPIGIKGPDDGDFVEESSLVDRDMNHGAQADDLPVEGVQLTRTDIVEGRPMFPGGDYALMRFMDENCDYSQSAIRRKLEGDVEVAFIIDEEGNVTNIEIVRSLNPTLDNAVLLAVKKMPKWRPGTAHGRPIATKISIPVHFQVR